MEEEEHKLRHRVLHKELDELIADFIKDTGKLPSKTNLIELMEWSFNQTKMAEKEESYEIDEEQMTKDFYKKKVKGDKEE